MQIRKIARDKTGSIMISVILGLGLAALFRHACVGDHCVVVRSPDLSDVKSHIYRVSSDSCYTYTPEAVACPRSSDKDGSGGGSSGVVVQAR